MKKIIFFFTLLALSTPILAHIAITEKQLVLFVAGRNNAQWYKKNLDSIFNQNYENYHVIYVDDASSDGTGKLVTDYILERGLEDKITLIINETRCYKMANQYNAIHRYCDNSDLIVEIDADDWFAHDHALTYINELFQDENLWLAYGNYDFYPEDSSAAKHTGEIPQGVIEKNLFRAYKWVCSGLRIYYAGLFKKIRKEDLFYNGTYKNFSGKFTPKSSDNSIMFPMLEMCRDNHFIYIEDPLYICNRERSVDGKSTYSQDFSLMGIEIMKLIRKKPRYPVLETADWY